MDADRPIPSDLAFRQIHIYRHDPMHKTADGPLHTYISNPLLDTSVGRYTQSN